MTTKTNVNANKNKILGSWTSMDTEHYWYYLPIMSV